MKKTITVFTPSYNRGYCLWKGYEALKRQTSKDFVWIIVDDGSTDNTREIVQKWIESEREFKIIYVYKENGGLHTGYNTAIEIADTELCLCVDSDDYLTDNAIELFIKKWRSEGSDKLAGIAALDAYEDKTIIGDPFPNQKTINLLDVSMGKYKYKNGDRKLAVRTDLYKSVTPMPSFNNEKNFNPHLMHLMISKNYDFLILNEPLCIVEYQKDGMSNGIYKQYLNSPCSFATMRLFMLELENTTFKFRMRHAIHYVSSSIISHNRNFLKKSPRKIETVLAIPFGILLTLFIKYKTKK